MRTSSCSTSMPRVTSRPTRSLCRTPRACASCWWMAGSWGAAAGSSEVQGAGGRGARRCSSCRGARDGRAAMTSGPPLIEPAALIPVYRDRDGHVRLVLIRRGEGGVHGGHLAFPGGKRDPDDASMQDTAVREAEEEI